MHFSFYRVILDKHGSLVKRLRRRPLTAESGVRFPYELLSNFISVICNYGSLVKRLRRRPLTAESGVRFPYELLCYFYNSPTRNARNIVSGIFKCFCLSEKVNSARKLKFHTED